MVQWNFIYSRLILYNFFSSDKFVLQGHNIQISSKYRKEIGQKISAGHNSPIADEVMNQVRRAQIMWETERISERYLTLNSIRESRTTESSFFNNRFSFVFVFSLAWWSCWGSFTLNLQGQILTIGPVVQLE